MWFGSERIMRACIKDQERFFLCEHDLKRNQRYLFSTDKEGRPIFKYKKVLCSNFSYPCLDLEKRKHFRRIRDIICSNKGVKLTQETIFKLCRYEDLEEKEGILQKKLHG